MRHKALQINPAGNNLYLVRRCTAVTNNLCAFLSCCRDDAISLLNELSFHFETQRRLRCIWVCQLLQACQRVEHRDVRNVPALCQLHSDHSREPVMTVQDIILLARPRTKFLDLLRESGQITIKLIFMNGSRRPGRNVDDAHARADQYNLWCIFVCTPGEDINAKLGLTQFARQLVNVNVHAARVSGPSRHIQWGRMDAEHSNRITHTRYMLLFLDCA